jgi:hypothetical protein
MENAHNACGYPVCPVCGKTMLFTEPVIRARDFLVHLDCRGHDPEPPKSN